MSRIRWILFISIGMLSWFVSFDLRADDWPCWLGPQGDSQWRETGIVDRFPEKGLPIKWRAEVGLGYSGPVVAGNKVFVSDFLTKDKFTNDPGKRDTLVGEERIVCFDAGTGKQIWKYAYPCTYSISFGGGPRATPTVWDGKVYSFGAEGNLVCLAADSGKLLWQLDVKKQYETKTPIWGFSSSPVIEDHHLFLIIGGKEHAAISLDPATGKELWKSLSSTEPGYSSPTLITAGGKRQLIIWHPESLNSLDPTSGKVYWSIGLKPSYGMSIMTPRQAGDTLTVGGIVTVGMGVKLNPDQPTAVEAYRGERDKGIFPVNSTPVVVKGYLYGISQEGELMAIKPDTGEQLWQTLKATVKSERKVKNATAFLVQNGDKTFLFNESGELILARLSSKGYDEISRFRLLEPTNSSFDRPVVWSHPAFAQRCVFARNDKELICASLAAEEK